MGQHLPFRYLNPRGLGLITLFVTFGYVQSKIIIVMDFMSVNNLNIAHGLICVISNLSFNIKVHKY